MTKRRARRQRGRGAAARRAVVCADPGRDAPPGPRDPPGPIESRQPATIPRSAAREAATPIVRFEAFGRSFWIFSGFAILAGAICYAAKGPAVVRDSLAGDLDLLLFIAPRFAAAMLIAAFVQMLLPRERIAHYVSEGAGLKAVGIATVAGGLTPGGPMTSFPLVRALREAGTGRSALVAYITSWSTLGFQRVLNWELPLLGPDFTLIRILASLPLPIIAGLTSRWLPRTDDDRHEAPTDAR